MILEQNSAVSVSRSYRSPWYTVDWMENGYLKHVLHEDCMSALTHALRLTLEDENNEFTVWELIEDTIENVPGHGETWDHTEEDEDGLVSFFFYEDEN